MKCIVCVKQVPDTSGVVAVKEDGTMDRAAMATITNHDDLAAVEAALRIKDATGCKVVVVSMGPPPAEGMLRELLAMGCDEAVLVSAREFGGSDTYATSQILAAAIKKVGVDEDDIVFCGRQAIDGDTAQVGPQIAEKLHLPQVSYVAEIAVENKAVTVKRLLEDGYMAIKVQTPCLLTCVKELNDARYMSVGGIMECYLELTTGLRRGELLGLKWEDIDLERGDLRVRRQIARINGEVVEAPLKTKNAYRTLPLAEDTIGVLEAQRKKTGDSPWVFPSPTGGPISPDSVLRMLHRVLKRAGLPRVRFHDLRHTFATLALQNGVDVKTVSGMLGHFSAGFTLDTYAHVTTASQRQAAKTMGNLLSSSLQT